MWRYYEKRMPLFRSEAGKMNRTGHIISISWSFFVIMENIKFLVT